MKNSIILVALLMSASSANSLTDINHLMVKISNFGLDMQVENSLSSNDQSDPNEQILRSSIENGDQIIVRIKGVVYQLVNPVYDGFYKAIIGKLKIVTIDQIEPTYTEVLAAEFEKQLGTHSIFFTEIRGVRHATNR